MTLSIAQQTQNRLRGFKAHLQALCDLHGFDLVAEDGEIKVADRRDTRSFGLRRDWPYMATLRTKGRMELEFLEYERLRGYGDGIVAPVAAAFIRAYMEIQRARAG